MNNNLFVVKGFINKSFRLIQIYLQKQLKKKHTELINFWFKIKSIVATPQKGSTIAGNNM